MKVVGVVGVQSPTSNDGPLNSNEWASYGTNYRAGIITAIPNRKIEWVLHYRRSGII